MKIQIRQWIVVCGTIYGTMSHRLPAQTHVDLRSQTKSADLSSLGATKPAQTGAVLPSACGIGEVFFLTSASAGTNLMVCASSNQWTASGAVSAGSLATQAAGASVGAATTLNLLPGTYVTQTVTCSSGTCSYQPDVDTTRISTNTTIQLGQLLAVTTTSSSSTSYTGVMSLSDPIPAYAANQELIWNVGSTACAGGPMTLNIDGLGAIPLKQADGVTNLTSPQCGANGPLALIYDAVNAVFRGPAASTTATGGTGSSVTGGFCTNQVATAISTSGAPTCATVTAAYADTSIAHTGVDINTSYQVANLSNVTNASLGTAALASGAVTASKMAAVDTRRTCILDNDTQSSTPLTAVQFSGRCVIPYAATIVEIDVIGGTGTVSSTAGPPTITGTGSIQLGKYTPNGGNSVTGLLSGSLATSAGKACVLTSISGACINGITSSSMVTISTTGLSAGDVVYVSAASPDNAQTWYSIAIVFAVN
jgi:hypothetical protein